MKYFKSILYLDKEFISEQFENSKGFCPQTKITKSENVNAGMKALFLSAGASATESKTFERSTSQMLDELSDELNDYQTFKCNLHSVGSTSQFAWVEGSMFTSSVIVKRRKSTITLVGKPSAPCSEDQEKIVTKESYFSIEDQNNNKFALITTGDYFSSGIESLLAMQESVVGELDFKVKALLRVLPARSSFKEWLAVPLVILEKSS